MADDPNDELEPGEPESATILYLSDRCPLCHAKLNTLWPGSTTRKCPNCGARIKQGVPEETGFH